MSIRATRKPGGWLQAFAGRKRWLHCAKNMRASAFIYLYRKLLLNDTEAAASLPMREVWNPNPVWQHFINQVTSAHANNLAKLAGPAQP